MSSDSECFIAHGSTALPGGDTFISVGLGFVLRCYWFLTGSVIILGLNRSANFVVWVYFIDYSSDNSQF
jgi:hypothetical protein